MSCHPPKTTYAPRKRAASARPRKELELSQTHALYRFFGAGGTLLYIGITNSLPRRLSQHNGDKEWFHGVANVTVEHYPTRDAVLAAEKRAIIAERPLYNEVHNRDVAPARDARPAPSSGLRVVCFDCQGDIRGERGVLHVYQPAVNRASQEAMRVREKRAAKAVDGIVVLSGADLFDWPESVAWQVHCDDCNPHYDDETDSYCNSCYWIHATRVRTWSRLVELTAHLSDKSWLEHTDWFDFIRKTALGTSPVGLVAPADETGEA